MNEKARQTQLFFHRLFIKFREHEITNLFYIVVLTISVGTVFYHFVEKWRYIDSLYFTVSTLTTVGLGDFRPETDLGKLFTIVYSLIGIGIVLGYIDAIARYTRRKSVDNEGSVKHEQNDSNKTTQ